MHAWAYFFTVLGGAGELASLIWGGWAALRGRRRIRRRMADYRQARSDWDAAIARHDQGIFDFVHDDNNADGDALNAHHLDAMARALGRPVQDQPEPELMPEQAALAVLHDQVRALLGPVLLLVLSALSSTAGGLLSID